MGDCLSAFPRAGEHPYKIIAFDWDGTAVTDRRADAAPVAAATYDLLKLDVLVVVITGTNFGNINRQFCSLISGPCKRNLYVCANRGSEVYGFKEDGSNVLLFRREATAVENKLLNHIAEAVKDDIESRSRVTINIIYDRLNRRKIDLIPEWQDPPKSQIDKLIKATEKRLQQGGYGSIKSAFELTAHYARQLGLTAARITSDVKHIEVGLTDKSDSLRWVAGQLARRNNISFKDILIVGDEFGPVAGFEGSDFRMMLPEIKGATYVSVGKEPNGVPAGVVHLEGGPKCFLKLIKKQAALHQELLPSPDPTEVLVETGFNSLREREIESLFAIGNGYLGTRGSLEEQAQASEPATLVAGVYDQTSEESMEELVVLPDWLYAQIYVNGEELTVSKKSLLEHCRILDLKKGLLFREWRHRGRNNQVTLIKFVRFVSLADPHALVEKVTIEPQNFRGEIKVKTGLKVCRDCRPALQILEKVAGPGRRGALIRAKTVFTGVTLAEFQKSRVAGGFIRPSQTSSADDSGVMESYSWTAGEGQAVTIEKYVSIYTTRETSSPVQEVKAHGRRLEAHGVAELMLDHIEAWKRRWETAAIGVDHKESQHWLNFAIYHLISAGNPYDERTSVSARALTGPIYKGHIFWDAEMFILPFFIFTHPPTARAMLMYRFHTLAAARENALKQGYAGALFSWEATTTGEDMTPAAVLDPKGEIVLVRSGKLEHHISAAVAWGAWSYWNATNDDGFMVGAGAELLIETARFWASRVTEKGGQYHILGVEGPDEYHDEGVDDNFYTNAMARWNLRRAAEVVDWMKESYPQEWSLLKVKLGFDIGEPGRWLRIADRIFLGGKIDSGATVGPGMAASGAAGCRPGPIEQFRGYFRLEDIDIGLFEPRTAPLDVILGRERTNASQVIKQADVVMALYLLEEELSSDLIGSSFYYYERRTAHGSSLSPAIYGLVAARLGDREKAWRYFHQAARIDLANGNAAGGIHVAAQGGLWQQVIMGFAGVRIRKEGIFLLPQLPEAWSKLSFSLLWRNMRLVFDISRDRDINLNVVGEGETMVGIFGEGLRLVRGGKQYIAPWRGDTWDNFTPVDKV